MTLTQPQTFESHPEAQTWIESVLLWLESDSPSPAPSPFLNARGDLRAPEEPTWSLDITEHIIEFLTKANAQKRWSNSDSSPPSQSGSIKRRLNSLVQSIAAWQLRLLHDAAANEQPEIDLIVAEQNSRLYQNLYAWNLPAAEGPLLQCLAWNRQPQAIQLLVELLVQLPPHDWSATAIAISPLMRHNDWKVELVFPRFMESMQHTTVVAPMLDLANFVTRQKMVDAHPAKDRIESLTSLLGGVVSRLGILEEDPSKFGDTVAKIQHVLGESVALCVSLCDAIAWIGDASAIGKLNQALELRHRRVQTEAAAALAKLGDEAGKNALLRLAAEPAARLRVLAYADELGIADQLDETWMSSSARAEAELAVWLSQPQQIGLAPSQLEQVYERVQYWPGYNDPQECFLFRYSYKFPDAELSNIGIAGPMVHSFASDLAELPENDIYAAFAGWCAEHSDIYEVDVANFNSAQQAEMRRLMSHLDQEGHHEIVPLFLGFFIGERALVARTQLNDTEGIAVTDGLELLWLPTQGRVRPLGPTEVHSIYKGRKILRTFNG